ncbi:MAG: hypothetical protein V4692_12475 [Bdellovibrionota bacterium]
MSNADAGKLISLEGEIDENSVFDPVDVSDVSNVVVDLEKVSRINSVGIRSWMIWFNKNLRGKNLSFRACPPIVVNQFNLVGEFLPQDARVESFFIPLFCENCEQGKNQLMKAGVDYRAATADSVANIKIKTANCSSCNTEMILDTNEKVYFGFLRRVTIK